MFVVVSGPPGSGKSTVAEPLARELGLPLIAKDTIKEALMDVLGAPDVEASKRLGAASIEVMVAVAAASPVGAVLDCNFRRSIAVGNSDACPVGWSRCSAGSTGARHGSASERERAPATPATSTRSGPAVSPGAMR